jgi:dCMP deaminase
MSGKREDYSSWDENFMTIARVVAQRSKDPSTQVGSTIVSKENKIIATGYNGMPNGIDDDDDDISWTKSSEDPTENKYMYVVHSELNAILNSTQSCKGSTLYTTLYPCENCR